MKNLNYFDLGSAPGVLPVAKGGTNGTDAATARSNLGIANPTAWQDISSSLVNSFAIATTSAGGWARIRKHFNGVSDLVEFQLAITRSSLPAQNTLILTLPSGFYPTKITQKMYPAQLKTSGGVGTDAVPTRIDFSNNGNVSFYDFYNRSSITATILDYMYISEVWSAIT